MKIEAIHDFHEKRNAQLWADQFTPSPDRIDLFDTIIHAIEAHCEKEIHVLELGMGPGFLANYILDRLKGISYEGLDNSEPMLEIAKDRLGRSLDRVTFTKADLVSEKWTNRLSRRPDAIITTWALHDLYSQENIFSVYDHACQVLNEDGIFINGDFIKPEGSSFTYEGGRLYPATHLNLLKKVGFKKATCLKIFELDIENPTTANNYACFIGIK